MCSVHTLFQVMKDGQTIADSSGAVSGTHAASSEKAIGRTRRPGRGASVSNGISRKLEDGRTGAELGRTKSAPGHAGATGRDRPKSVGECGLCGAGAASEGLFDFERRTPSGPVRDSLCGKWHDQDSPLLSIPGCASCWGTKRLRRRPCAPYSEPSGVHADPGPARGGKNNGAPRSDPAKLRSLWAAGGRGG